MDFRNRGLISLNQTGSFGGHVQEARTLVVTGVARSGTSMVARVLDGAGVFMGKHLDDVVFEDLDFATLFSQASIDHDVLTRMLRDRNRAYPVWGFKRPHLHMHREARIGLFRNPSVIVMVRDPVAVAERNAIAEQLDVVQTLSMATLDLQQMMQFVEALTCPVLLVSYEKALRQPDSFVARLLEFCGLDVPVAKQARLTALVEPDRPAYIESARRIYEGYVDEIQDTILIGWAHQRGVDLPVTVTVFRDDEAVRIGVADQYRGDLADCGIGDGRHGFAIDLAGFGFTRHSCVTVRIDGRSFTLNNSGASASALGADIEMMESQPIDPWGPMSFGVT